MATFFLVIIYLAFISLGLPDSLLGVAWPVMSAEYGAPLETAGWLFMTIAAGTIVSSLVSGIVLKRFGTGQVTFVSCLLTAGSLLGFHFAPSVVWLVIFAIPLGIGAGSVDAGLNNYVATHYKAHHMSWLHCFWGVGATLGPIIMAQSISGGILGEAGILQLPAFSSHWSSSFSSPCLYGIKSQKTALPRLRKRRTNRLLPCLKKMLYKQNLCELKA